MYSDIFFWDTLSIPSNWSLFLLPPESGSTISDTADFIAFPLKSSDRRGGIDFYDIHRLTKQNIFISTFINDLEHHLDNNINVLAIVFNQDSFLDNHLISYLELNGFSAS